MLSVGPTGSNGTQSPGAFTEQRIPLGGNPDSVVFTTRSAISPRDRDDSLFDIYLATPSGTQLVSSPSRTSDVSVLAPELADASDDGSAVFFTTGEDLVAADDDGEEDLYKYEDRQLYALTESDDATTDSFLSAPGLSSSDGSRVVFDTDEQLHPSDTDGAMDSYIVTSGGISLLTAALDPQETRVRAVGLSNDGMTALLSTEASLLAADGDEEADLYLKSGETLTLVTGTGIAGNGSGLRTLPFPVLSADGERVIFQTDERLLSTDEDVSFQDVYAWEGGTLELLSTSPSDTEGLGTPGSGNEDAELLEQSEDARYVYFSTDEPLTDEDPNLSSDAYRRGPGGLEIVTSGPAEPESITAPDIELNRLNVSEDGLRASFTTLRALLSEDADTALDAYAFRDGELELVSVPSEGTGPSGGHAALAPGLDHALFVSSVPGGPGDLNDADDVFLRNDNQTLALGPFGSDGAAPIAESADGRRVLVTTKSALSTCDESDSDDLYLIELDAPKTNPKVVFERGPLVKASRIKANVCSPEADVSFVCRVDNGPENPCGEAIKTTRLSKGRHTISLQAVSESGERGPRVKRDVRV